MSSTKRLIEVSEEEYEKIQRKKSKREDKEIAKKIKQRHCQLQKKLIGTSIHNALVEGILKSDDDNIIVRDYDSERDENLLWSIDYLDLVDGEILDCDKEYQDIIEYKLNLDYAEPLFRGIPITPKVQGIISDISERIRELNTAKGIIMNKINHELKNAIWEAANNFIKTQDLR